MNASSIGAEAEITYNLTAPWMPWEKTGDLRCGMMRWGQNAKVKKGK